jgi:hypothetical protein
MKTYYVYLLTDPRNNNEVFYCGKGSGDRWKSHLGHWSGNGKNNPTENKIRKMQSEGFQPGVRFLHENIADEKLAYDLETAYIEENFDNLTNVKKDSRPPSAKGRIGWSRGKNLSEQHKANISKGLLGHKRGNYSDEHRRAISESLKGEKHPMYGKPANNRKCIIETTTNTVYTDQITASTTLGLRQGDIANCLAGRQKSVKGFKFEYVNK